MSDKPFNTLTKDEATALARSCVRGAKSEAEIRDRLTAAGFNGEAASIDSTREGGYFMAMALVWGPRGEVISA